MARKFSPEMIAWSNSLGDAMEDLFALRCCEHAGKDFATVTVDELTEAMTEHGAAVADLWNVAIGKDGFWRAKL